MQRDATLDAVNQQFKTARDQGVRDVRARTARLILEQARLRSGVYDKLLFALESRRVDVAANLVARLLTVDAESDDLLFMTVEDTRFREAVESFLQSHQEIMSTLLAKANLASWTLKVEEVEGPISILPTFVQDIQRAADAWVASPVS